MPHNIVLPTDLSDRAAQLALYTELVTELPDLQTTLQAALTAARGPQAAELRKLSDRDKAALRDLLTKANAGLNNGQDVSGLLGLAVTAHNTIVDGLNAPAPVVARPATSVTGTHVMPAVVEEPPAFRLPLATDTPAPRPRPVAVVAPAAPPTPPSRDVRVAAAPVPPNPPRGGDRPQSGCTLTADHVMDVIRRMPQAERDRLRQIAGDQGNGGLFRTLLTERRSSGRGAHQ